MDEQLLQLDLIYSKISYVLACLANYSSLNLSLEITHINDNISLIKKSLMENKDYLDIRDVIAFRNQLMELKKKVKDEKEVPLSGHKIACLLFEITTLIHLFIVKYPDLNNDFQEYLDIASNYLYYCGRIINIEILSYEN